MSISVYVGIGRMGDGIENITENTYLRNKDGEVCNVLGREAAEDFAGTLFSDDDPLTAVVVFDVV